MKEPVAVSACLLGVHCRYDGGTTPAELHLPEGTFPVPVCPEQLGGMPTPRPPCELPRGSGEEVLKGKVPVLEVHSGEDRTQNFLRGARETLDLCRRLGITRAYLKQRSPSCGLGELSRNGTVVSGNGVTAALLLENGVKVEPRG